MGVLCVVFSIHRVFLTCDLYVWFYTLKKICSKAATVKAVKVVPQPGGRDELQDQLNLTVSPTDKVTCVATRAGYWSSIKHSSRMGDALLLPFCS